MEPLKLSQAIEENIIELFSWIFLFPITLGKLMAYPLPFLKKMATEHSKPEHQRFDTSMPPIIFLLFGSVPLSIAVVKTSEDALGMPSIPDASLLLALYISCFPFAWTLSAIAASNEIFGKEKFRQAFGSQCYLFCPVWFTLLIFILASQLQAIVIAAIFSFLVIAILIWLLIVEWRLLVQLSSKKRGSFFFLLAIGVSIIIWNGLIELAQLTGQTWLG